MRKPLRVGVLVSGGGTNLGALIKEKAAGRLPLVTLAVVVSSNPAAYALTRAADAGIPTAVIDPKQKGFGDELLALLGGYGVDILVLAGFLTILPDKVIEVYRDRILNVHPSLIPSFCGKGCYGLRVHKAALEAGVKVTGATVHYVNETPDGGRILLQKAVEVREDDTPESLQRRVMEQAEWVLLPQGICILAEKLMKEGYADEETGAFEPV